jgi:hypothetical protein
VVVSANLALTHTRAMDDATVTVVRQLEALTRRERQMLIRNWLRPMQGVLRDGSFAEAMARDGPKSALTVGLCQAALIAKAWRDHTARRTSLVRDTALARILIQSPATVYLHVRDPPARFIPVTGLSIRVTRHGYAQLVASYTRQPGDADTAARLTLRYSCKTRLFTGRDFTMNRNLSFYRAAAVIPPSDSLQFTAALTMARAWGRYATATQHLIVQRVLGLPPAS